MITIAWDVDDVLNDLMYNWLTDKWLPEHRDCKVYFDQITENTPERIINSTKEDYLSSLDNFRLSKDYSKMKPDPEILAWFERSGDKARHIALTSVPVRTAHMSAEWVLKNFGRWIRSFNFIPSPRAGEHAPEYDRSKAGYLKWLGKVDILVEDSEQNIEGARALGIRGMLVARPWNKKGLSVSGVLKKIDMVIEEYHDQVI
ncbi:MAG: hypothetical protein ABH883_00115 [Candidatus Omnitrophota bacterium]